MQRVVILGNAGSGKSTLARSLGQRLGIRVVHLDPLFWEPGWVEPDPEQFRARVREAIAGQTWICEGNYSRRTFDLRLPRADLIIWLDTPRSTCLARVVIRQLRKHPRSDLPEGCHEKMDRAFGIFLKYVWGFDRKSRPGIEAMHEAIGPHVPAVHLRGTRQIKAFLDQFPVAPAVAGNPHGGFCEGGGHKGTSSRPVSTHHTVRRDLIIKALEHHAMPRWVVLYCQRWL